MKHFIASLFIFATWCTGASACEYHAALCDLMRQVESGSAGSALERVEALAKGGDLQAQLALGAIYGTGKGVAQNDTKALTWLLQAARTGDPAAQSLVGNFYASGRAGPIDLVEAKKWYEFAANAGEHDAQKMLGILYARGESVPINYSAAYLWFSLASLGGDAEAVKYQNLVLPYLSQSDLAGLKEKIRTWTPSRTISP
jgi:TPR repeat protein